MSNRMGRLAWSIVWTLLFRPSPRPFHSWRAFLLRCFGAKLGPNCHFYPRSRMWAPWNLMCADGVTLGDEAEIYNPSPVTMGSHAIVSQQAYICGATHDYNDPAFPLISFPMSLGAYSWVCARASVSPGVNVGEGAVLGSVGGHARSGALDGVRGRSGAAHKATSGTRTKQCDDVISWTPHPSAGMISPGSPVSVWDRPKEKCA